MQEVNAMTEDITLDIRLPIAEWDDIERRMACLMMSFQLANSR